MPTLTQQQIDELRELYEKTTQETWNAVALLTDREEHHVIAGEWSEQSAVATKDSPHGLVLFADLADNAKFCATIHNVFPDILATLAEKDVMLRRWKLAVEGLTPNGSEYVDDPEACAAAIRSRTRWPQQIIALRAELQQANERISDIEQCDKCDLCEDHHK